MCELVCICVEIVLVLQVSEWGKLLVANTDDDESRRDFSDALYVQVNISNAVSFFRFSDFLVHY